MSSFTNHTSISPSEEHRGLWVNDNGYYYYSDMFGKRITIYVPKGYVFNGASIPSFLLWMIGVGFWYVNDPFCLFIFLIAALIQSVQTDTIAGSGVHDRGYTHERRIGRVKLDIMYIEMQIVYNIPKLLERKKYLLAFIKVLQYSLMGAGLLLGSRWVWYAIDKKLKEWRQTGRIR